ncbi:MAG TPA: FecR domain-containing protein [Polyangiaceae bacterium]|nr:FecR domain-containing protein [Polyangiaceae bacterium]
MAEPEAHDPIEHLAELERRAALGSSTEMQRSLSRQRFLARFETEGVAVRVSLRRWAMPAAAAICLAAALLFFLPPRALTFEVRGAELNGKYVSAPEGRVAELRFSDESTLVAEPGSRLRVEDTYSQGARVLIERGHASVHVVHESSTAWTFAAGPFEVHVTGTRFDLGWDPASETCDLSLLEGSVEVRGLAGSGPIVVRAGQHFQGDARRGTMQVLAPGSSVVPNASLSSVASFPPIPEPSAIAELAEPAAPAVEPSSGAVEHQTRRAHQASWSERVAQGQFKEVVADAEARGIAGCLSNCSAADLRALSDAARYTSNTDVAERSLTAMRQRFPGATGSEAAFLLGRLHEKRGTLSTALGFYDSYLSEAPGGAFAAEALAGKMRTVRTLQGQSAAQPLARDYLRRFPKGVHVSTARQILSEK